MARKLHLRQPPIGLSSQFISCPGRRLSTWATDFGWHDLPVWTSAPRHVRMSAAGSHLQSSHALAELLVRVDAACSKPAGADKCAAAEWRHRTRRAPSGMSVTHVRYRWHVAENLTSVDPYELCRALLDNSDALVEDAGLLLEHGRHPRAVALALMALEELSKVYLCIEAILEGTPVPVARSRSWADHREKLAGAAALELAFLRESPDFDRARVQQSVTADQRAKLACLYVDHSDGQIAKPSELAVDASLFVDRAGRAVAWLRNVLRHLNPDVIDAVRPHREVIEQYFASLVDEDDMEATVGRLRAAVAAASELGIEPLDEAGPRAQARPSES